MMARSIVRTSQAGVAALALMAMQPSAMAGGSVKDEPEARAFTWSVNIAGTTDYVFRGVSQTAEDPTIQGGVDIGYGILYAGIWGSGVDFGDALSSDIEIDYYAGIKPVWGPVTFDLGVIYYTYPGSSDEGAELDYVEIKVGASGQFIPNLTTGVTVFY
jgi:uncharacterized protein (TIGR02001 family)